MLWICYESSFVLDLVITNITVNPCKHFTKSLLVSRCLSLWCRRMVDSLPLAKMPDLLPFAQQERLSQRRESGVEFHVNLLIFSRFGVHMTWIYWNRSELGTQVCLKACTKRTEPFRVFDWGRPKCCSFVGWGWTTSILDCGSYKASWFLVHICIIQRSSWSSSCWKVNAMILLRLRRLPIKKWWV